MVFVGLSVKIRMLMRSRLRRALRVAGIVRRDHVSSFELTLSREGLRRYAIESVKPIHRRTVLKTLRTSGSAALLPVLPERLPIEEEWDENELGETGAAARIRFVRLTPEQALSAFEVIRERNPDVGKLYASLEEKGFESIGERARGAVIRAYSADGVARGEGTVIELPHKSTYGTEARINVSIEDRMAKGEVISSEVRADYEIKRGEQLDVYKIKDGRPQLAKVAKTSRRTGVAE